MKIHRNRQCVWLALLLVWAVADRAQAVTYLDDCANNGVNLESDVSLGYLNVPGAPPTAVLGTFPAGAPVPPGFDHVTTHIGPVLVVNPPSVSGSTATTPPTLTIAPATGPLKDRVDFTAEAFFEFGTPSGSFGQDTFRFRALGNASAVGAQLIAGDPADGQARVQHRIYFFNDLVPAGGPATTCAGGLQLPNMRTLAPYEVGMKLDVIEDYAVSPTVVVSQGPGDPATSFVLNPGKGYMLRYEYEYRVPHGIDPPFDGSYAVTIAPPPPVPSFGKGWGGITLLLSLLAAFALLCGRRALQT